jgi:nucleotide-binding universal stress UspA family protein
MMKSILVSLTGFDSDEVALETAMLVGGPLGAHFDCLHVRPGPHQLAFGDTSNDFAGVLASDLVQIMQERDATYTGRAKMAFNFFRKRLDIPDAQSATAIPGPTAAWKECFGNHIDRTIAASRYHDLAVFGRDPDFTPISRDAIGHIVLGCGRPVLLSPAKAPSRIGGVIAIAWKDCPQAARAITAAGPLIHQAQKIVVITAIEDGNEAASAERSAAALSRHFRWHGIHSEICILHPISGIAEAIVNNAQELGADLVVMGAYGHSRIREIVFGGFTDCVLKSAPLPVLMFH